MTIKKELSKIFEELFQEGIIKTYITTEDSAEFSFNTINESPHTVYIESENKIYLELEEDGGEDEEGNYLRDEGKTIEIKLSNIKDLKEAIIKQRQNYLHAQNS